MIRDCKKNAFRPPIWVDEYNNLRFISPGITYAKKNKGVNEGVYLEIEGVKEGAKHV